VKKTVRASRWTVVYVNLVQLDQELTNGRCEFGEIPNRVVAGILSFYPIVDRSGIRIALTWLPEP